MQHVFEKGDRVTRIGHETVSGVILKLDRGYAEVSFEHKDTRTFRVRHTMAFLPTEQLKLVRPVFTLPTEPAPAAAVTADPAPEPAASGRTRVRASAKDVLAMLLLCLTLLGFGCVSPGTAPGQDVERLGRIAAAAAYVGASLHLEQHPQSRPQFEAAEQALASLLAAEDYDPLKFAQVIRTLPALESPSGAIYVSGAVLLWDEFLAATTPMDRAPGVKLVLARVRDGLQRALTATHKDH